MRFKGLDLNLLVAFDALIETRSVSRAAERLNLSQPAVSAALRRLRDYFGDPILVVHGKRMLPTSFADSLAAQVRASLRGVEVLIATTTSFDPATSRRTFKFLCSDFATTAILAPLVQRLALSAPSIRIDMAAPEGNFLAELDQGIVDLLIIPEEHISSSHPADLLFEERHVVVGCAKNPMFQQEITEDIFFSSRHVAVSFGHFRQGAFADQHLQALGRERNIEVLASSFTAIPWLVTGTPRLALMHERLAHQMAKLFPIAFAPLPFAFPVMREMMAYHHARRSDEGLAWLRNQLLEISAGSAIN